MNRDKSLYQLSHDHHHALKLAQLISQGSPLLKNLPATIEDKAGYTVDFFYKNLTLHFEEEENVLYPFIKGKNKLLDELFLEIFDEHKKIRELIKRLEQKENIEETLHKLGAFLKDHIRKEERELFTMLQEILFESELTELGKLLKREGVDKEK